MTCGRATRRRTRSCGRRSIERVRRAASSTCEHLMRVILNSRTYQLSRRDAAGQRDRHAVLLALLRPPAAGRGAARRDRARRPACPRSSPATRGVRAVQVPDPGLNSYFLALFGRSERVTACACERSGEVTMPQLLHLQNGEAVVQKIRAGDGRLAGLLKKTADDAGDRGTLPRHPLTNTVAARTRRHPRPTRCHPRPRRILPRSSLGTSQRKRIFFVQSLDAVHVVLTEPRAQDSTQRMVNSQCKRSMTGRSLFIDHFALTTDY